MREKLKAKVVIAGAGPTGLGAAWRLKELQQLEFDTDWLIIDGAKGPGGLASSIVDENGFVWDLGGHVLFSHYDYFDQVLDQCMKGEWVEHAREAWVWLREQFIPYPFQNNIWRLPAPDLVECLEGLLSVHNKPALPLRSDSFEDWIYRNFGTGLAKIFFLPYNFKVWAYHPKKVSACWIQERVATVDLSKILKNLILREDELGWGPNSKFRFPLRGGTGMIWQRVNENLPAERKVFGKNISKIDAKAHRLELSDGTVVEYDSLISTIPLDNFIQMTSGIDVKCAPKDFLYSSTNLVGVGLEGQPPPELKTKCWMYFVEDQFPFYRVTVFSNYSKYNVPRPGEQWSLLCEVSESPDKPVNQATLKEEVVAGLKACGIIKDEKIVSLWQTRLEHGYPTPFLERDQLIEPLNKELCSHDIYSRGRFGAWKYEVSNQDHSFMQGVEAVDHILFGNEELTYFHPAVVNSGKRNMRTAFFPEQVSSKK